MASETKDLILDAAEVLFAKDGFGSTSLRHITARAGVNLASVNYHFGSKEALIKAVFERRIIPMNQRRLECLERLQEQYSGPEIPLDGLIEAFVGPAVALSAHREEGGAVFLRLLGRSYTESSVMLQQAICTMYAPVIDRFREAFVRVLPELPADELYWRMHFMVGLVAYIMSGTDMMRLIASCRLCDSSDTDMVIKRLGAFLSAGMQAPLPIEVI